MALEDELKKAMGYTEDTKQRCPNCTHCESRQVAGVAGTGLLCTANKAVELTVSPEGRCNLFSAKRRRGTQEEQQAA